MGHKENGLNKEKGDSRLSCVTQVGRVSKGVSTKHLSHFSFPHFSTETDPTAALLAKPARPLPRVKAEYLQIPKCGTKGSRPLLAILSSVARKIFCQAPDHLDGQQRQFPSNPCSHVRPHERVMGKLQQKKFVNGKTQEEKLPEMKYKHRKPKAR